MISINPLKLSGNWHEGYALDLHTLSSEFVGYDDNEREIFATKRSAIGEILYQLKYKHDTKLLSELVNTAAKFLQDRWKIAKVIDGIIPVPPSKSRPWQPVSQIARGIGAAIKVPVLEQYLSKNKQTPELKNLLDYQARLTVLSDAFEVQDVLLRAKLFCYSMICIGLVLP
jgi:competence protein ComFC